MPRQWEERVRVYRYPKTPTLDEGVGKNIYEFVNSGEPDGAFAMSRGVPSGRDVSIAAQRSHRADAVFCCDEDVPVESNGLLRDLDDDRLYTVTSINHARRAGELIITAEYADDSKHAVTGEP